MKFLDLNGVSILWRRIKTLFARKNETVSNISRNNTTFTVTRADGTTFTFDQKDTTYNNATTSTAGLMSATDKAKLNSIENGAQENVVESVLVNGTKQAVTNKGINITIPTAVSSLNNDLGYLTEESDPTVPSWAKQAQKPVYTASEVGALSADTKVPTKVSDLVDDSGHYTKPSGGIPSTDLSSDVQTTLGKTDAIAQDVSNIQDAVAGLTEKLNALADSDDTTLDQMSEIVTYIKNNKSLIDGITTGKVSVADIVDNLTSNAANKPLSAKQGKALKDMIDGIVVPTKVSQLTNDAGYLTEHQDISGKQDVVTDLAAIRSGASLGATALQEETDPTVPTWAKASTKPTYTAAEVGALPDDTVIPSKVSELTNDAEYITSSDVATPDWNAASGDDGYIDNKPNIRKGTDAKGTGVAEGSGTTASGASSHSEGGGTTASGDQSHAEGGGTTASGSVSHAEGGGTRASGYGSHSEGGGTTASGNSSHAEGNGTLASGNYSHAEGIGTQAMSDYQHVQGKYNIADDSGTYAHIVGGGTSGWTNQRANIHTLDWNGNAWYAGKVTVGTAPTADLDVTTKKYVDDNIPTVPTNVSSFTNDAGYLTQHQDISGKANISDLSAVATSGSYNDLSNKPTIPTLPTNVSAFNNDAGYLTQHQDISGKANSADLATVATSGSYNDLSNKPTIPTVPTKISAFTNDADYANEQYVDDAITAALADVVGIEYHVCTANEYDAQTYIPTLEGAPGVIYLVPKPASLIGSATVGSSSVSGNNIYYEFIYNGRSFEMIGDTQVSLDGYLEDSDVSTDAQVQSVITEVFGGA